MCPRRALGRWKVHFDRDAHALLRPSAREPELGWARVEEPAGLGLAPADWRGGAGER